MELHCSSLGRRFGFILGASFKTSIADAAERESNLRLGVLYLLALGGVITVMTTAAIFIDIVIQQTARRGYIHQRLHPTNRRTDFNWRAARRGVGILRSLAQSSHRKHRRRGSSIGHKACIFLYPIHSGIGCGIHRRGIAY